MSDICGGVDLLSNAISQDGKAALHYAALNGTTNVIRQLLDCGASMTVVDNVRDIEGAIGKLRGCCWIVLFNGLHLIHVCGCVHIMSIAII